MVDPRKMKLRILDEKTETSKGVKNKKVLLAPEKDNQVLTYQQIRGFINAKKKDLPKGRSIIVRGVNLLRDTTLYSSYIDDEWKTDDEWDDYLQGKAKDSNKYKYFHRFTVEIQYV